MAEPRMQPAQTVIGIFTRAPIAGQTKTRLIPALGAQGAARLHQQLLDATLTTATATGMQRILWAADTPDHPVLSALAAQHGCSVQMQQGSGLGARMYHALATMLAQHPRALLIGSDCAVHSVESLQAASNALQDADIVFTPAEDGGYVLVGARTVHAAAFEQIDWGTARVMAQTRERLRAGAVSWSELPALWDIDTAEDVTRARALGLIA
jgi:uncharacterized protein